MANQNFGIQRDICQSTGAIQMGMCQGFNQTNAAIAESRFVAQQCCCETNRNIDAVRAENYKNTCEITTAIHAEAEATRALMTANVMQELRDQLQAAQLQLGNLSQTQNIINAVRPFPQPAYITCDRFIKSSSITASSSDVIITISSAPTLTNLKRFCLVLAQNLPEGANTLPVQISIGGTTYPVYTRTGNLLRADQIRCRRVYPIIFGNDPNHFSEEVVDKLYKECYGEHFSDWLAEKAVENFKNVDGTEGAHWTIEQIDDVIRQYGIKCVGFNRWDLYYVMNMLYSDYYNVLGSDTAIYVKLSKAWFEDPDVSEGKAYRYYMQVAKA